MDNLEFQGCILDSHQNNTICSICLDKNCSQNPRTICQSCHSNTHSECKVFLQILDKFSQNIKLTYKNQQEQQQQQNETNTPFEQLFQQITQYELDFCQKLDQEFEKMLQNLEKALAKIKKELKIKQLDTLQHLKQETQIHLETEYQFNNLTTLKEEIQNYKNGQISFQDLNNFLYQKQQQSPDFQQLNSLQNKLNKIKDKELKIENQAFLNSSLKSLLNLENSIQRQEISQKIMPFPSINFSESNLYRKLSRRDEYTLLQQNTFFKSDDVVQFSFKLNFRDPSSRQFQLILTPKKFLQEQDLYNARSIKCESFIAFHKDINTQRFRQTSEQSIDQIHKNGQIYQIKINIKENIFTIQDQNQTCIIENKEQFDPQFDEWRIFILKRNNIKFTLL